MCGIFKLCLIVYCLATSTFDGTGSESLVGDDGKAAENAPQGGASVATGAQNRPRAHAQLLHVRWAQAYAAFRDKTTINFQYIYHIAFWLLEKSTTLLASNK